MPSVMIFQSGMPRVYTLQNPKNKLSNKYYKIIGSL